MIDTEELEQFLIGMEAYMMLNWEKLKALDVEGKFEEMKMDAESALADLKAKEREDWENSDDPHGYGDWRNDNGYAE